MAAFQISKTAEVRVFYTNYEHKVPNEEKFREDGLLEAPSVKRQTYPLRQIKRRERMWKLRKREQWLKTFLKKFCSSTWNVTSFPPKKASEKSCTILF